MGKLEQKTKRPENEPDEDTKIETEETSADEMPETEDQTGQGTKSNTGSTPNPQN